MNLNSILDAFAQRDGGKQTLSQMLGVKDQPQYADRSDTLVDALPPQDPVTLEDMKNSAGGFASGTVGGIGDLVKLFSQVNTAKNFGYWDEDASSGGLPTTGSVGESLGVDVNSPAFNLSTFLSADPFGKIAKGVGLAMPFVSKIGKTGKPTSKWGAHSMGYKHDIADGAVTKKPFNEMSRTFTHVGTPIERRTMNPEELLNQLLVPLLGDRSDAGKMLTHVGDQELANAVELLGGHGFMRYNPDMLWASNAGAVKMINNKANRGLELGVPTSGVYMPMKHLEPSNFNTMTTDVIYEQIAAGNHSQRMLKKFDDKMKEARPEWKGLAHPNARAQLHSNGALRHEFQRVNNLQDFQKYGFPDPHEARFATTDPDLMHYGNVPLHQGGQSIGSFSGETISNPLRPHPTYDTNIGGTYTGAMPESIPREVMFPTWYKDRRANRMSPGTDSGSFNRKKPVQFADQEWLDGIMKYLMRNNR
jgi:hypothetical protein